MIDLSLNRDIYYASRRIEVGWTEKSGKGRVTQGTGFLIKKLEPSPPRVFLVTNRHVLDPEYRHRKYLGQVRSIDRISIIGFEGEIADGDPTQTIVITDFKVQTSDNWNEDAAVVPVGVVTVVGPKVVRRSWNFNTLAAEDEYGDAIRAGDMIVSIGFPKFGDYQTQRPVLTSGLIATDPMFPAPHPKYDNARVVLSDSFSRSGMSGSPVIAVQRGLKLGDSLAGLPHREMRLVGVNAGHLRAEDGDTMGLAHFVRADVIRCLIEKCGASPPTILLT